MFAVTMFAQCRLPEVAPGAIARMSAFELVDAGHFHEAVTRLEPIVKTQPGNGEAAWLFSRAKSYLGDLDEALKLAEGALVTEEANSAYHVQVAAVAGRMAQKASLLKQLGLARRVKKELDETVRLNPKNSDGQYGLMMFYYAAPSLLGGDKNKSKSIGEELAKTVPDLGLYYQARLAHEMKEFDKEEAFYKQSILVNPLLYDAYLGLAELYLSADKRAPAKAAMWACQAIRTDPTRGQAWSALARVLALDGCWTEATQAAGLAEAINPRDLAPYYAIATAALERGDQTETAIEYLRKYIAQPAEGNEPSVAMGHWQLGLAVDKQGDRAAGIAEIQAALKMDSTLDGAKADLKRLQAKQ